MSFKSRIRFLCLFGKPSTGRAPTVMSQLLPMSGAKIKLISLLAGDDAGVLFNPFPDGSFRKSLPSDPLQRNTPKI